jgi:hypothetical protein
MTSFFALTDSGGSVAPSFAGVSPARWFESAGASFPRGVGND